MDKQAVFANVLSRHQDEPYSHLEDMSVDELCNRRLEIANLIKELDNEKQAIDVHLKFHLSSFELSHGIRVDSDHIILMRKKTTWKYSSQLKKNIELLRKQEQKNGEAYSEVTEYLCITKA